MNGLSGFLLGGCGALLDDELPPCSPRRDDVAVLWKEGPVNWGLATEGELVVVLIKVRLFLPLTLCRGLVL